MCSKQNCEFCLSSGLGIKFSNYLNISLSLWSQTSSSSHFFFLFCWWNWSGILLQWLSHWGMWSGAKWSLGQGNCRTLADKIPQDSITPQPLSGLFWHCKRCFDFLFCFSDLIVFNGFLSSHQRQKVISASQLLFSHSDSSAGVSDCNGMIFALGSSEFTKSPL